MADLQNGSQGGAKGSQPAGRLEMSLREFSRKIGISDTAVRKAVKKGRLKRSLGKTAGGDTCIIDFEVAQTEWHRSTRTGVGVRTENGSQGSQQQVDTPNQPKAEQQPPLKVDPDDDSGGGTTLFEAQRQATLERARELRLRNDVTEGRLVPIDQVSKEAFEAERIIRESILNIPSRISGELAAESDPARVYLKLDAALREALNSTADSLLVAAANE